MGSKINVAEILRDHRATIYDAETGLLAWSDVWWFAGAPLVVSATMLMGGIYISQSAVGNVIAVFSLLAGLLLNLLVLVFDLRLKESVPARSRKKIGELYYNISFGVLLAISLTVPCLLLLWDGAPDWLRILLSGAIYFGAAHFASTVLMILKRVHKLLKADARS